MYKLYAKKYPVETLMAEIRKCRVLCCNCHMEATYENPNYVRSNPILLEELEEKLNEI